MSEYAQRRMAEILAGMGRVRRSRRAPNIPKNINFGNPVHKKAHQYIKRVRLTAQEVATWFDVHDAYVAGWIAAKGGTKPPTTGRR